MRLQDVLIHQCPSKGTLDLIASKMRFKLASRTFAAGLFSSDDGVQLMGLMIEVSFDDTLLANLVGEAEDRKLHQWPLFSTL
jgi:hypothetical protein